MTGLSEQTAGTVRSGYVPVLIYTPVVLARDRGYYDQLGIDARLERLKTGADIVPFTLSGRFDVAVGGPGPDFWRALADGYNLRLIAPLHAERPPAVTPLLVRADLVETGAVESVADLRDRPVSSPSPGVPLFWLDSALRSGGLGVEDVDLRIVGYGDVGAAFQSGEIDAALLGEPLVADLVERGLAIRLASDFVDGLQPTYLYCLRSTLEDRRDEIVRFVAGYLRACADLESDDSKRSWQAESTRLTVASFTDVGNQAIPDPMRPTYEPEATFRYGSLERLYRFFVNRGDVEPMSGFEPSSLIDAAVGPDALALLQFES